jgi:hypothetical protein
MKTGQERVERPAPSDNAGPAYRKYFPRARLDDFAGS